MEEASVDAKATAANSAWWLGGGVVVAMLLAGLLAWHTCATSCVRFGR